MGGYPEQLGLKVRMHLADFVQEQSAVISEFEFSQLAAQGAGESPLLMAEKFAFQQTLRQGGTVDGDKRSPGPVAVSMKVAGQDFLTGAGLSLDEDSGPGGGH
jgi:hypothetical protein